MKTGGQRRSSPAKGARGLKRILVPTDFSVLSLAALPQAQLFAEAFGSELILLHVIETFPIDYVVGLPESKQLHATVEENARRQIKRVAGKMGRLPVQSIVRWGKPFQEIVTAARELPADLIVLTTHGHTGLKHVYLGSTAERVVRHAHCPVLVMRPD